MTATHPSHRLPGRIMAKHAPGKTLGKRPPPSTVADQLYDAAFGEQAAKLAEAAWRTPRDDGEDA